ncbi:hypothetical protein BDZ91DRAFT_770816 [Kalaharituber pfeilii]|nr:hypothetical protein BDZ91DRAFT_770816 [Kalaharituber pfeilii]
MSNSHGLQSTGAQRPIQASSAHTSANFSTLVSTVVRTTGADVPPLVGSSTTIIEDTLYVFGGQRLSRTRPGLSNDIYALDLTTLEWTQLETKGDIPSPRYFHSVCALADTKLVCFGGMSPNGGNEANTSPQRPSAQHSSHQLPREVVVMSDIHIFDIPSKTWSYIPTTDAPEGRYAHCATILPSSAAFTNVNIPAQVILSNGVLDGLGGAEMVVVGGQNSANQYMDEISVFNLRSLKWTSTRSLDRYCGAYRSVVSPLPKGMTAAMIGAGSSATLNGTSGAIKSLGGGGGVVVAQGEDPSSNNSAPGNPAANSEGHAMLIYSNYNFLEVRLELQVRLPDGTLVEKPLAGPYSPPGLRFPNGGVIDNHFVLSGTYLTSSKQEYALWVLDLRTLVWSKIDVGNVFSQGSWNRGILWNKRNTFLILGKKDRSLVEDYNQRRVNFNHICMVTLEAFGLYDNPRMNSHPALQRHFDKGAQELGRLALGMRDLADMDFLAVGGERVPVNSRIIARRWGPYFMELLNSANPASASPTSASFGQNARMTPNNHHIPPTPSQISPLTRPRTLYLPHTHQTLLTLVHFLYTSTLPPPSHPQSSPQILCSLLQLARPYRVEGLLEAVVERLHQVLDGKNAAAVFNAAAMAAVVGGSGLRTPPAAGAAAAEDPDHFAKGAISSVIGLQKRGLRGLMEGRRMRERGRSVGAGVNGNGASVQ